MAMHERKGESDEWYTPRYIFDALGVQFDLDVASPEAITFVPAQKFITEGSLEKDWNGFVWMNPPFGNQNEKLKWIRKFVLHGNGIALLPDRSSTLWWQHFAIQSEAILQVHGKIKFHRPDGTTGDSPSTGTTLFAMGTKGVDALIKASRDYRLGIVLKQLH